jgi:4-carboxymuconolactone decarboxylase
MVAMKSWEEFELHVRAGLENELSPVELKEMLLLAAIYCGVPAANSAFAHARKLVESRIKP